MSDRAYPTWQVPQSEGNQFRDSGHTSPTSALNVATCGPGQSGPRRGNGGAIIPCLLQNGVSSYPTAKNTMGVSSSKIPRLLMTVPPNSSSGKPSSTYSKE